MVCALLDHNRGGCPSLYNSKASIDTLESATSSANEKSLDVNSWTTVENFTALHVAAHSGHTDLIELLLAKYKVRFSIHYSKAIITFRGHPHMASDDFWPFLT